MSAGENPRYGTINSHYAARLADTPAESDGPVWMVNLMKYHGTTAPADGAEMTDQLRTDIGAQLVFSGDVDQQLIGQPTWDRVGVVKFPTRKSFIDVRSRPDFHEAHRSKEAVLQQAVVLGCRPLPYPEAPAGVVEVDWADVPHPPTADDGPVTIVHVLRFTDTAAAHTVPDEMAAYASAIAEIATKQGARVAGWFAVEGTFLGDGRVWHQVRFNQFPSKRAFLALATDRQRLQAQKEHRDDAIADTYTMIVRPGIQQIAESITS
ncbi:MAG: hypothetical protein K2Q25_14180 [Mycobacteriaceae bacterium]|nr:hypothetical protein [Mycobacteriaceae bacterium]